MGIIAQIAYITILSLTGITYSEETGADTWMIGETMSDYIKREDAKKWLTNLREDCGRYQDLWHYAEALNQIIESLDADVAPVRHGHWIKISPAGIYECSECGKNVMTSDIEAYEYCHGCGARMDDDK